MKHRSLAALALIAASSLRRRPQRRGRFQLLRRRSPGTWTYAATADGSEATFRDASARPQLMVALHARDAARRDRQAGERRRAVPRASGPARNRATLPASFNPATARLTARPSPRIDPLLDAIAFSRGRIAVSVGTPPALVLPPWPEPARVIEDCRV